MEPGKPPHPAPSDAGGPAAYRGEASSSSSSPPQQGHATPRLLLPPPSPPRDRAAGSPPLGLPVPGAIPPLGSPQHPDGRSEASSSGGHLSTLDAGTAARNFEQIPGATSCYYSLGPSAVTIWTPSNADWSGASDRFRPAFIPNTDFRMVVQQPLPEQRYAAQTLPEPPQMGPEPPRDETPSSSSEASEPPIPEDPRLEEIRSELLDSPTMLEQLVLSSPESSAFVVRLLVQGDKHGDIRQSVLDGFVHRAHRIMENSQGHAVFQALLRICQWRPEELSRIVDAAVEPNLVSRTNDGS